MVRRLVAVVAVCGLCGCNEECVDQFDCGKIASKNTLTCENGRCVVKTTLPPLPNFGPADAGRRDAGIDAGLADGGMPDLPWRPGSYTARLTGGQLIPPLTTSATGSAEATLSADDAGTVTLTWNAAVTNATVTSAALLFDAPAGRPAATVLPISDGGLSGSLVLTRAQAAALSTNRAALQLGTLDRPDGGLRGQLLPRGALAGFTQLVRTSTGQYGGGGQLVLEFTGMFPTAGSYDFGWPESGRVAAAALVQGGAVVLPLELDAFRTGARAGFEPIPFLLGLRDGGLFVVGTAADGGEVFRGDFALSLR